MRSNPSRRRAPLAAVALALALVASACGGSDVDTEVEVGAAAGAADDATASLFTGEATTIDGETFDLATLAGEDLIVWFWAPW